MKKAFTLAEVLITLGVIGIVAALTMPALIANYQKKVTVTQLQKAVSVLAQAASAASADSGFATSEITDKASLITYAENYMFPYLKTVQICTDDITKCGVESWKYLNGTDYVFNANMIAAVLPDGLTLVMRYTGTTAYFFLDINGRKGPNVFGKDLFRFGYSNGKAALHSTGGVNMADGTVSTAREALTIGTGVNQPGYVCNATTGVEGYYCGALIQYDGWEIKDDYPW